VANFKFRDLGYIQLPTAKRAAAVLRALARDEAHGRRPERLTEPRLGTWTRFLGRMESFAPQERMFDDAAVLHLVPLTLPLPGLRSR